MSKDKEKPDINSATASQLTSVKGIGPKTAQIIIENRPYYRRTQLKTKAKIREKHYELLKNSLVCRRKKVSSSSSHDTSEDTDDATDVVDSPSCSEEAPGEAETEKKKKTKDPGEIEGDALNSVGRKKKTQSRTTSSSAHVQTTLFSSLKISVATWNVNKDGNRLMAKSILKQEMFKFKNRYPDFIVLTEFESSRVKKGHKNGIYESLQQNFDYYWIGHYEVSQASGSSGDTTIMMYRRDKWVHNPNANLPSGKKNRMQEELNTHDASKQIHRFGRLWLQHKDYKDVTVLLIGCHMAYNNKSFVQKSFLKFWKELKECNEKYCFAVGDFNVGPNELISASKAPNKGKVTQLNVALDEKSSPTKFNLSGGSILDNCISTANLKLIHSCIDEANAYSDHYPVTFQYQIKE